MSPATLYSLNGTPDRLAGGSVLIDQACAMLGVSRRKVYYLIRDGRLRTIRTRCHSQRILLASIAEFLAAGQSRGPHDAASDRQLPPDHPVVACP